MFQWECGDLTSSALLRRQVHRTFPVGFGVGFPCYKPQVMESAVWGRGSRKIETDEREQENNKCYWGEGGWVLRLRGVDRMKGDWGWVKTGF